MKSVQIRRKNLNKMIHRTFTNILKRVFDSRVSSIRNSALFINGAKATEQFAYLTPYIDFTERIKQKELLHNELVTRKSKIVLVEIESVWQVYEDLTKQKAEYVKRKDEISREWGKLFKTEPDSEAVKKLKIQIDLLKDNIKKLKVPLWSAEEAAIVEVLKLPNSLHSHTPQGENKILYTHLSIPKCKKDHLKIGKDLNILHFLKNENYYLKGDAALFELGAKFYFNRILRKHKFIQFSNPDFVKSLIVEGCGKDHTNPDKTFILQHNEDSKVNVDSRLHLTGGGSLCSFLAYHAKNVVYEKVLPLKYFTMGRQYVPAPSKKDSLFHVSQSSVIEIFGVTKTAQDLDENLYQLVDVLKEAYQALGYHFRLSIISAEKLCMWESLRVTVEMYSSSLQDYVEVANVSLSSDFISKRLMFTYVQNKESKFPHILSGTFMNVPKFLGCVLEQDMDFAMPEPFKVNNWTL